MKAIKEITLNDIVDQLNLSQVNGKEISGLTYFYNGTNVTVFTISAYYKRFDCERRYIWHNAKDFLDSHGINANQLKDLI